MIRMPKKLEREGLSQCGGELVELQAVRDTVTSVESNIKSVASRRAAPLADELRLEYVRRFATMKGPNGEQWG